MDASVSGESGMLYVVATPIGNLGDMTARAIEVLSRVDIIAAEDTRHSAPLLRHFGITTHALSLHEHNETERVPQLVELLRAGKSIALISDAGTPLVSDPGFRLVRAARTEGIQVVPVPGACAAIAALSVAGLPSDRFVFEGFSPMRASARQEYFIGLASEERTLIFYESPHRIIDTLADMAHAFGPERKAVVARELTKKFEIVHDGTLTQLHARIRDNSHEHLGEFVILVHGATVPQGDVDASAEAVLKILLVELPVKQAAALAARITGVSKNALYRRALELRPEVIDDE